MTNVSVTNQTQQRSICSRVRDIYGHISIYGHVRLLRMKHFIWQSTPVQVRDPMTSRTGSIHEVVLDIPGMICQLEVDVWLTADAAGTWSSSLDGATTRRRSSGPCQRSGTFKQRITTNSNCEAANYDGLLLQLFVGCLAQSWKLHCNVIKRKRIDPVQRLKVGVIFFAG